MGEGYFSSKRVGSFLVDLARFSYFLTCTEDTMILSGHILYWPLICNIFSVQEQVIGNVPSVGEYEKRLSAVVPLLMDVGGADRSLLTRSLG